MAYIYIGFETVIGAVYQSPYKPLVEKDLDKLVGLSKSKKFLFGATSMRSSHNKKKNIGKACG